MKWWRYLWPFPTPNQVVQWFFMSSYILKVYLTSSDKSRDCTIFYALENCMFQHFLNLTLLQWLVECCFPWLLNGIDPYYLHLPFNKHFNMNLSTFNVYYCYTWSDSWVVTAGLSSPHDESYKAVPCLNIHFWFQF